MPILTSWDAVKPALGNILGWDTGMMWLINVFFILSCTISTQNYNHLFVQERGIESLGSKASGMIKFSDGCPAYHAVWSDADTYSWSRAL